MRPINNQNKLIQQVYNLAEEFKNEFNQRIPDLLLDKKPVQI
ncbi:hypothetical protein OKW21_001424 [Catalinimonas alkaloidigena]|nr:hypothetical protein [Catalinimonas alkaloidigena]